MPFELQRVRIFFTQLASSPQLAFEVPSIQNMIAVLPCKCGKLARSVQKKMKTHPYKKEHPAKLTSQKQTLAEKNLKSF